MSLQSMSFSLDRLSLKQKARNLRRLRAQDISIHFSQPAEGSSQKVLAYIRPALRRRTSYSSIR